MPRVPDRGYYAAGGTPQTRTHQLPCNQRGSFCVAGELVLCAAGTWSDAAASSNCQPCIAGRFSLAGASTCTDCLEGKAAVNQGSSTCAACEAGSIAPHRAASVCEECRAGRFQRGSAANASCEPCSKGRFSLGGVSACRECELGKFADGESSSGCTFCSAGKVAIQEGQYACQECVRGTFSVNPALACRSCEPRKIAPRNGSDVCLPCPDFADSPDSITCQCARGRFLSVRGLCESCPQGMRSSCAQPGQVETGLLPDEGWYKINGTLTAIECAPGACVGGQKQCAANREGYLCAFCAPSYSEWQGVCARCDESQAGFIALFLLLCGLYLLFAFHTAADSAGLADIFLGFCQVSLVIVGEQVKAIDWLEMFSMSPQDSTPGHCFAELDPYQKFTFSAVVPALLIAELLVAGALHRLYAHWRGVEFPSSVYKRTALSLLVAAYLPVTTTSIRYLDCRSYGDRTLVASALAIQCDTAKYTAGLVLTSIMLTCVTVGFPLFLVALLLLNRQRVQSREETFVARWGIFFDSFTPAAFMWQEWELARRVAYVGFDVLFYKSRRIRACAFAVLSLASYMALQSTQPYAQKPSSPNLNHIGQLALFSLVLLSVTLLGNPNLTDISVDNFANNDYRLWVTVCCSVFVLLPAILLLGVVILRSRPVLYLADRFCRKRAPSDSADADLGYTSLSEDTSLDLNELSSAAKRDASLLH